MSKKLMNELINELRTLRQTLQRIDVAKPKRVQEKQTKKTNVVENPTLHRYIRPIDDETGEIDSQQGVTLKIKLDYKHRKLNFRYSICNHTKGEPSFSKKAGIQLAANRPVYSIPLWQGPGHLKDNDLTAFIVNAINDGTVKVPSGDRKHIVDQFERSNFNFGLKLGY